MPGLYVTVRPCFEQRHLHPLSPAGLNHPQLCRLLALVAQGKLPLPQPPLHVFKCGSMEAIGSPYQHLWHGSARRNKSSSSLPEAQRNSETAKRTPPQEQKI